MVHKLELRVHAGASSRYEDDERYRSLAHAYAAFNSRRSIDLNRIRLQSQEGHLVENVQKSGPTAFEGATQLGDSTLIGAGANDFDPGESRLLDGRKPSVSVRQDPLTFVEDTQLAYTAIESQIFTSSLATQGLVYTARRQSLDEQSEEWPEDLPRQSSSKASFERQELFASGHDEPAGSERIRAHGETPTNGALPQRTLNRRSSSSSSTSHTDIKRVEAKQKILAPKPFKLPLKRPVIDVPRPTTPPAAPADHHGHSQQTISTPSSYLKTPDLRRVGIKRPHSDVSSSQDAIQKVTPEKYMSSSHSTTLSSPELGRSAKKTRLVDYRERTPPRQPLAGTDHPILAGKGKDITFLGGTNAKKPSNPAEKDGEPTRVSGEGNDSSSELPTSYGLSSITSQSSRGRLRPSQRSTSDPGPVSESLDRDPQAAPLIAVHSQPANPHDTARLSPQAARQTRDELKTSIAAPTVANRPSESQNACQIQAEPQVESSVVAVAEDAATTSPLPKTSTSPASLQTLPLAIYPPEPVAALAKFTTHVTYHMNFLAESSFAKDSYKPVSTSRELGRLERGHWLLPSSGISTWPTTLQLDFWNFLSQFISSGNGGWGLWCAREVQHGDGQGSLGTVRVYCWGEVVKHVYLLLYTASQSKVRKMGLQWVNGEGKVVVHMRGKGS
ncbi:hypothetical protein KC332_g3467 [Hortaea werneckii]|uniref:Uncharacterized protein n=1 Tax=Hortaea werneckii TaxID=91943 RepID=A0A3M7J9G3_HORWE|nr:hypothetical protein KC350_g5643 [Hortaea werneckii]KAI6849404.1 hypothetical protein KC358_g1194 [Hortaea werneckii]KAI6943747.1 hypothetical protein KC341_g1291 [Hortaea werneckii]KAI6945694.1 hypothetical protein KC348_g3640 [Hortaea werneckii]KAI6981728.1 hypothetical protein KC321_g1061 [Hortaea werneckii]